jgi:hypothetical protein
MARYTGPKPELLVTYEYSEMTKHSKEEVTHLNTAKKRGKKSEYAIQLMRSKKAKYSYLENNSEVYSKKHH